MTDSSEALEALKRRLASGPALTPSGRDHRVPKPIYLLSVDDPDEQSIVLIVRTSKDGIVRAFIALPQWQELPEGWDGPHEMEVAIPLADSYAHEYGYRGIAIDIESSQLWDAAWGELSGGASEI